MEIHMFFHIEDVPTDEITDPEEDKDKEKGPEGNRVSAVGNTSLFCSHRECMLPRTKVVPTSSVIEWIVVR